MSTSRNTGLGPTRRSRIARVASALGLAALAGGLAGLAACADATSPTALAPNAPNRAGAATSTGSVVYDSPIAVAVLERSTALSQNVTASITLNGIGGSLDVPGTGLHVTIPKTALPASDRPITITVTALKGKQIAYEFGPSGTKFKAALNVTQDLTYTSWAGNTGNTTLQANYFKSVTDLSPSTGTALSYETLPADVMASGNRLHWDVWHFSGYMVATGRK